MMNTFNKGIVFLALELVTNAATMQIARADGQMPIQGPDDCLAFTSEGGFTLKTANLRKNWDVWLEWSTNKIVWVEWNGEEIRSAPTGDMGNYSLYVRGVAPGPLPDQVNTVITGFDGDKKWVLTPTGENKIICLGNIETLRGAKGEMPAPAPMGQFCYWGMFQDCPSLISAPELPAETLAADCYARMFNGCISLTSAPELPAMTLTASCYERMFSDCTSLRSAPTLLATNLAAYCYSEMFLRCTEITNLQEVLPAMTLSERCYRGMFMACDSLTNVPELPATNLANFCYQNMFNGCTGIKMSSTSPGKPWSIPADATTADDWNAGMFAGTGGDFTGAPEVGKTYYFGVEKTAIAGGFTARSYQGDCTITGKGELAGASEVEYPGITNLIISAGVTKVGDSAFRGWNSLRNVTIGADCQELGAEAFFSCSSLERIAFDGEMPKGVCDAVIIQTTINPDGSTSIVPDISVSGWNKVLFGKKLLTDDKWINLGSPSQRMQESGCSFFQIQLVQSE